MPQPTISDVHVNSRLTTFAVAFMQDASDFAATQAFPIIPSEHKSDVYTIYNQGDWMRIVAQKRAPGAPSAGGGYKLDTDSFLVERWAIHKDVDDPTRSNSDDPLRPDEDATAWVTEQILRTMESEWATEFFVAGVWGSDVTPGTLWDAGGSTPVEDIRAERRGIIGLTGKRPNTIVTTQAVFDTLVDHPDVIDRVKYTQNASVITESMLAQLFQVSRFVVSTGIYTTSAEGAAADTFDFIVPDHLWLGYVDPNPGPRTATAGATFSWTGLTGSGSTGIRVKKFRLEEYESDRIEAEAWWDFEVVAPSLGVLFEDPIS